MFSRVDCAIGQPFWCSEFKVELLSTYWGKVVWIDGHREAFVNEETFGKIRLGVVCCR